MDIHKKQFKSEWLNTPNAYIREEMEETGTPNPKKYAKVRLLLGWECPGAHFTNDFASIIQIRWKFDFSVTPL